MITPDKNKILVVERDKNGLRKFAEYQPNWSFYVDDPKGKFRTIYDTPVTRIHPKSNKEYRRDIAMYPKEKQWESDCNPVFRCLAENYLHKTPPKLHVGFFDIEVDFDPERGFAPTDDPFNKITAVTIYLQWIDQLITLALPPSHLSSETAHDLISDIDNTFLFDNESDLLESFLDIIDDVDVLSGWNSEGYDIPYMVNRIIKILSKNDTRRLCLWSQSPKERIFLRYGAENKTYDLIGRIHIDYMNIYRKYTYEERQSYSLQSIVEHELGDTKTPYEGSLDELYNKDFKKFIIYNRQDVVLLGKLDIKLKFIELSNSIAHDNTVLIQTTAGSVAVIDQGIINAAHEKGLIVPNRKIIEQQFTKIDSDEDDDDDDDEFEGKAAGAYVAYPKTGLHDWIGSVDINSLYPSTIRALNMSPETIIGQIRSSMTEKFISDKIAELSMTKNGKSKSKSGSFFANAWEGMFSTLEYSAVMNMDSSILLTIDWEDGNSSSHTADEVWNIIFKSGKPWTLSANGTIFSYKKVGVIPGLLSKWYTERKSYQAELKQWLDLDDGIKIPDRLLD